jgi:TolB-like protein
MFIRAIRWIATIAVLLPVCAAYGADLDGAAQLYSKGDYQAAAALLEQVRQEDPQSADAALLLGLTYLRLDRPEEAEGEWKDFAELSKEPGRTAEIRRYRTLLLHEANVRAARAAVEQEQKLSSEPTDERTVAIAAFQNLGTSKYAPLGKAFTAMLIDNLSAVPDLKVLERERVEALVQEAELAKAGLADSKTAVRAGKLLRARRVTAGSYKDWAASPDHLGIEALLVDVDQGKEIGTFSEEGMMESFHELIPKLSADLAGAVGHPVDSLTTEQKQEVQDSHTQNLECVLAFGEGLDAKDRQDYPAARDAFIRALRCGHFDLAQRELDALPLAALSLLGVAHAVESWALPSLAGTGAAAATAPVWTSPLVVGGAAAIAVTAGVVGSACGTGNCGGNGSDGSEPPIVGPPPGPEPRPPPSGEPPPHSPMQ